MLNNVVFIVTEGETDELFYKKILSVLKTKTPGNCYAVEKIEYICIKGFGKFESKLANKLKRKIAEYKKENKQVKTNVFLCYDNDVFVGKKNPPIDWAKIEKKLKSIGVSFVYHIIADKSIEDFILLDFDGVLKYLNIKNVKKNDYRGTEGLKRLYKKVGKGYIKGNRCDELLKNLDFNTIEKEICPQLMPLCSLIGAECKKNKM